MNDLTIRPATASDAALLARLISSANAPVAAKFGLNSKNSPKHPSFCTSSWIESDLARGERYFIGVLNDVPIACVATEYPSSEVAYLNRLSVLPAYQNAGVGAILTKHVLALAKARGASTVSIGVIGEHDWLLRWYEKLGFIPGELKRFPHLPFSVQFMSYALRDA